MLIRGSKLCFLLLLLLSSLIETRCEFRNASNFKARHFRKPAIKLIPFALPSVFAPTRNRKSPGSTSSRISAPNTWTSILSTRSVDDPRSARQVPFEKTRLVSGK